MAKRPSISLASQLDRPHLSGSQRDDEDNVVFPPDPVLPTRIRITLDQVITYKDNPRITENPKYEEIKESIRNSGLDHAPNVTRENPADPYMIKDGGNTRLTILNELWNETGDERFWSFDCMFYPWESHKALLLGHARENEMRGDTLFIERAINANKLKLVYEEEGGTTLSIRGLAKRITEDGWTLNQSVLTQMIYAHDILYPHIPTAFHNGMGRDAVQKLRKLLDSCGSAWELFSPAANTDLSFAEVWQSALSAIDAETIELDAAEQAICEAMARILDAPYPHVIAEVQAIAEGQGGSKTHTTQKTVSTEVTPPQNQATPHSEANINGQDQANDTLIKNPSIGYEQHEPNDIAPQKSDISGVNQNEFLSTGKLSHPAVESTDFAPSQYQDLLVYDSLTLKEMAIDAAMEYASFYQLEACITPILEHPGPHLGYQMSTDVQLEDHQLIHWLMLHLYSNLMDEQRCANNFLVEYVKVASGLVETDPGYNTYMLVNLISLRSHAMGEAIRGNQPVWKSIWKSLTTLEVITGILQTRTPEESAVLDAGLEPMYDNDIKDGLSGGE